MAVSDDGLSRHNPSLLENFIQSDLITYIENKREELSVFDVINLGHVLEHVIDPVGLLSNLKHVLRRTMCKCRLLKLLHCNRYISVEKTCGVVAKLHTQYEYTISN